MLLKNTGARLITITAKNGTEFALLPGNSPAVKVPDDACKNDFVQMLIDNGELLEVAGQAEEESEVPSSTERDEMIAELESLGVKVDKRWSNDRLKAELETALGE